MELCINHFDKLPSEVIEVIGSFLDDPKDTVAFCLTCRRNRAISMDKLRLYDPLIKISSPEVNRLLRKWKIPKLDIKNETTYKELVDSERKRLYAKDALSFFHTCRRIRAILKDKLRLYDPKITISSSEVACLLRRWKIPKFEIKKDTTYWQLNDKETVDFDPSDNKDFAIREAAKNGQLEIVQVLLADERFKPSADSKFALAVAAEKNNIQVVKLLLKDKRFDPSALDNYALKCAARNGRLEMVRLLLADKRVDPSAGQNYALVFASDSGNLEMVKLLLADKRFDPSNDIKFASSFASKNGHLDVVKFLLAYQESHRLIRD